MDDGGSCIIYDPESRLIKIWNCIFLVIAISNVFIDLLFCFLPVVSSNGVHIKYKPAYVIMLLRTITDCFFVMNIIIKFRTAHEASVQRIFGKRVLVSEPHKIAFKYLKSTFLIDLIATLPLPQAFLWRTVPWINTPPDTNLGYDELCWLISFQFLTKLFVIFPLRRELIKSSGMLMKNGWLGAASCLVYYIMLSHTTGAVYFSIYISQLLWCKEILLHKGIETGNLDWDQILTGCSMKDDFEQGMFSDAYEHKIGFRSFTQRYMYCFSWGLKCLSSMSQNLNTTFLTLETAFSFLMTIAGLLLFAGLIAHMQTSIQALGTGEELQMVRQRDFEEWTKQLELPPDLRKRVRHTVRSEWRVLQGLDDEVIMDTLPLELQREIRKHLHLELVSNLPFFANMDENLVHSFCGYLRAYTSYKGSFIAVEGEAVGQMFFIVSGQLEVLFIGDRCSTCPILGKGDICGQELLSWASCPFSSTQILPLSSQTLKCLTDVEAFVIRAKDLKLLALQLEYNLDWQQILRLYST